jgi:hypothetical protein
MKGLPMRWGVGAAGCGEPAIVEQIRKTNFTHVFLDVRHLPTKSFGNGFRIGAVSGSV